MAEKTMSAIEALEGEQYISLTTYRKNGNEVATPVWFAADNGKLYITTLSSAGKVRRIRNNGHVKFAACNARGIIHGESFNGMATVLDGDSHLSDHANNALKKKYGLMKSIFTFFGKLRGSEYIFIEVTPQ